ncbi:hypothetical protein CDD81_5335 [Ophiocordyceps australis]|uniref:Uncharacterized protein n=1 Tax=Ophiocordyceps australis TaxID=1399860 RepID=A0A2C5Y5B4_9HYPO|nr:hypothetical protein CDD81_5335 [Ophiocordyceps australis]
MPAPPKTRAATAKGVAKKSWTKSTAKSPPALPPSPRRPLANTPLGKKKTLKNPAPPHPPTVRETPRGVGATTGRVTKSPS